MKNILVIGTGFLGKVVMDTVQKKSLHAVHTYCGNKFFPDSVQLDLFAQSPSEVVDLASIDTVIFCSNIEKTKDADAVSHAMRRAFSDLKDKRVIYTSSDSVFDGTKGNYTETDTPTPANAYGKNKAHCEQLAQEIIPNLCIVRPSYIYGYSLGKLGGRLSEVVDVLAQNKIVKRFDDMYKSPSDVNQLADIMCIIAASDYRGVVHTGGERMSVYVFLKRALTALGVDTSLLQSEHMPVGTPGAFLRDTSLNAELLRQMFGITVATPEQCFKKKFTHHI